MMTKREKTILYILGAVVAVFLVAISLLREGILNGLGGLR